MSEALTIQHDHGVPLSAGQLTARLAVIQDVMRKVMQNGTDYGVIPGTDKPSLFKPGAEKLCVTFRLSAADPQIELVPEYSGDIRYRVRVPVMTADGTVIAVGVGECSTGEEKYRWRRPVHINEFNAAADDQKREKWTRNGDVWQQVRVNPADVANTVLKMAHKRAYVHAVIMATAAGAIFTQDIEDLPEGVETNGSAPAETPTKAPMQAPQRKTTAPAVGMQNGALVIQIEGVQPKEMNGPNGPWTKHLIRATDGKTYNTNKADLAQLAKDAQAAGESVSVTFTENKYGRDIKTLTVIEREAGADG